MIGSQAPDFDTVLKLKDNATYLRHHRGITHSLPAVVLWGVLISSIIYAFVPEVSYFHLWLWTFLAVIIHVLVDLFNAYGTQAFRPFTNKWVAYGFINTFDPYTCSWRIAGSVAWALSTHQGCTWVIFYVVIALYSMKLFMDKREIVQKMYVFLPDTERIAPSPTIKQNHWRVAI